MIQPFAIRWILGFTLLLFWTLAFVGLPALSGWFLASCSLAFILGTFFIYVIPSSIIRFLTLLRTGTRYYERLENHKTNLNAQNHLQLKIFQSVAQMPYFKKQGNNNASLLENSTQGIDLIMNYILLWFLPFLALILTVLIFTIFIQFYSSPVAIMFVISSFVLLFLLPQYLMYKNKRLYYVLKTEVEKNKQELIESFRGRIEISKYNLEEKAIKQQDKNVHFLQRLETQLSTNSFSLQFLTGFGMGIIALFIIWISNDFEISAPLAIGIFFGIMAQAELSEMLFSGKSERSSVENHINDLNSIIVQGEQGKKPEPITSELISLNLKDIQATIPYTHIITEELSFEIKKGEWIALYGETGKGKTTFLNSLFYPEYRQQGSVMWNGNNKLTQLPIPQCIYVTQKAYLLTGTLRENFEGYEDQDVTAILNTVDLKEWFVTLPNGLDSWIGENGETLSGGQRKKLLLAQALLKRPQLLVIDEPTAGISTENALHIFSNIKQTYPEMSLLMATHMTSLKNIVDKVIVM